MQYAHREENGLVVFQLSGNLLAETDRDNIAREVKNYLDKGFVHFLFDLTQLKHINSTGLGIFISLYARIKDTEGDMVLCNPSSHIRNLLLITKLDTVFKIEDDMAVARALLKA